MSDVLEHNVRRLLRRSYVPALPAPHFRDRLAAVVVAEVERRAPRHARKGAAPRRHARPRLVLGVAALAAAVLALVLGWRFLAGAPGTSPESRERLLARGEVALGLPSGEWRAADDEERFHGVHVAPPALVAATPAGVELDLLVTAGRIHLAERSEVLVELGSTARATLRSGAAAFHSGDAAVALERGVPRALVAGAARVPEAPEASEREPVPASPAAVPSVDPAAGGPAPAAERVLAGRVVSAASGEPVTAFTVALLAERTGNETPPPVRREFAGADGRFTWPDPPAGKQRVFVHAEGHALLRAGEHDLVAPATDLELVLEEGTTLSGSVVDHAGNPVAGALVLSEHDSPTDGLFLEGSEHVFWLPIRARTGPDGRFELAHLSSGVHTIRVSAPGHAPAWEENVRVPPVSAGPGAELELELPLGGTVEGTVTRADGGPWPGAQLVVLAMDQVQRPCTNFAVAETGADGRYRFEHLPPTTMIVVLVRRDGRPDVRPLQVIDESTITADFSTPRHGTRVIGRLLDSEGTPIAGQNLGLFERDTARWDEDWVASATHDDGSFEFEGIGPGRHLIYLIDTMGRGLRCVDEIEIAPGLPELARDVRLPSGTLEIAVVAATGGAPVADAAVLVTRVEPDGGGTFIGFGATDAAGSFAFRELGPGTYVAWAYPTHPELGFASAEPVALDAGGTAAVEIELGPGGAADVVVRDPDGRPLEGAIVVFRDEDGQEHTFSRLPYTDSRGRLRAQGLRPGVYRVSAMLAGHQGTPATFRFNLGDTPEVPLVLVPASAPAERAR